MPRRTTQPHRRHTAREIIQENPVKTAAAVVISLGIIIGGFLYADERWAHAAELRQFAAQTTQGLEIVRLTSEIGSLETQTLLVQQRISQMQSAKPTPETKAALYMATGELAAKQQDLTAKKQLLDKLRTSK